MLIKKLIHKFGDSQLLGTLTFAIEADIFAINFFSPFISENASDSQKQTLFPDLTTFPSKSISFEIPGAKNDVLIRLAGPGL